MLDRAIANTAMEAGVAFAYGATLVDLLWTHDGRVRGIVAQIGSGTARLGAGLVVGADGLRSLVARLVGATVTRTGSASAANVFGYWSGVPVDGYRWYYAPGLSAGAIPTNDGLTGTQGSNQGYTMIPFGDPRSDIDFATFFKEQGAKGYPQPELRAGQRARLGGTPEGRGSVPAVHAHQRSEHERPSRVAPPRPPRPAQAPGAVTAPGADRSYRPTT